MRVIYTLVNERSHPKPPNLPSFWPLTPEGNVRLTCAWSHLVGLYLLGPFGKLPNINRIYNQPKTSKLWICPFILQLMQRVYLQLNSPITCPQYQLPVPNLSHHCQPFVPLPALCSKSKPSGPAPSFKFISKTRSQFQIPAHSTGHRFTVPVPYSSRQCQPPAPNPSPQYEPSIPNLILRYHHPVPNLDP